MTATNTTPRVRQRSQNGDDGLEQHKGPVEGGSPGLWLRSSVGWSGARSWVSRHPTRSFMQYKIAPESNVRIEARPAWLCGQALPPRP